MITMPGGKDSPGNWAHYNLSMRVPKGLYDFLVIKVSTGGLFQAERITPEFRYSQVSSEVTKSTVSQNQDTITKRRQRAIVRGDND